MIDTVFKEDATTKKFWRLLIGALAISRVRFLLVAYSYRAANPNPVITIAMHPAIKGMMLSCDAAIEHA